MKYIEIIFRLAGSLGLFLYGMKVMGDGIQQAAGDRMQRVLSFMTGNRFAGVATGLGITAIIQSSSATTVMVISFVNAGLLTLTQAIGVIMGANIGTTVTAWIVSLVGFSLNISSLALPAVGIGFILMVGHRKTRDFGELLLGLGLLFLGLAFLTDSMPVLNDEAFNFISDFSDLGFISILLGTAVGLVMTLLVHSSSATTAIIITMTYKGVISYDIAAAMILGANIGTTIDAALASIGTRTAAKQAALVHILFNVIGTIWALIFFRPLIGLVDILTPGEMVGVGVTTHLAMFHTVFNTINTLLFLPFVGPFAALVAFLIKGDGKVPGPYKLKYLSGSIQNTPEFNILRAEKEIRDMAGIASSMFAQFKATLEDMKTEKVLSLVEDLKKKENLADEMQEELTGFLIECSSHQLNQRSEHHISQLLRVIAEIEDMIDDCYGLSIILERSVKKEQLFKHKEMEALSPYAGLVEEFLSFVQAHLGSLFSETERAYAEELEHRIHLSQKKLRKLGRKRIEAGESVKTELLFIDMVRRIEKLGNYCYHISKALGEDKLLVKT
ncbi:MAG: Na/Pi cotransporter family protein [Spirochaetaceae bacterium]|jgi:phosphate:Na+ symporter|nr:Na/Pi cotransporter family protein [Spirochaetaceae bacterium]